MMIDLRSDTFTLTSAAMREVMARAEVGDDYYGEDNSVNRLQDYCKELFRKEDALFTTTGMLANQLAVASQVAPGNEVVTEYSYHLNLYESAQHARFCNVVLNARQTQDGILGAAEIERAISSKPREAIYAQVELVAVENTINSRQGKIFPIEGLAEIREFTASRGIALHLDGARLFNAHIATGIPLSNYAAKADTVSVCFSKGLGAPLGSMLLGPREIIERARRLRVWHGSGFHQIGICAEAAYYGLTHQLERLREDHRLTRLLAERLAVSSLFDICLSDIQTNMIYLNLTGGPSIVEEFIARAAERGVLAYSFPPHAVRLVVCRNVEEPEIVKAADILLRICQEMAQEVGRAQSQLGARKIS